MKGWNQRQKSLAAYTLRPQKRLGKGQVFSQTSDLSSRAVEPNLALTRSVSEGEQSNNKNNSEEKQKYAQEEN